jgi:hypothetical protein
MNKKWIAINLILLAAAILLGWELIRSIEKFDEESQLSITKPLTAAKQPPKPAQAKPAINVTAVTAAPNVTNTPNVPIMPNTAVTAVNAPVDYSIIPQKNLFSETRSNVIPVEPVAPSEPPPLVQKPILVGIVNTGKGWQASIIDPASQDRNRRSQPKRVGDVYRGYVIKQILPDKIVLESGSRQEIIPLDEGFKQGLSGKTAAFAVRVVPFGKGKIAGTQPGGARGGPGAASAGAPGQSIVIQSGGNTIRIPQMNLTPQQQQQIQQIQQQLQQQQQTRPAQQQSQPSGTDSQGRRIIRSPFGDMTRPSN